REHLLREVLGDDHLRGDALVRSRIVATDGRLDLIGAEVPPGRQMYAQGFDSLLVHLEVVGERAVAGPLVGPSKQLLAAAGAAQRDGLRGAGCNHTGNLAQVCEVLAQRGVVVEAAGEAVAGDREDVVHIDPGGPAYLLDPL